MQKSRSFYEADRVTEMTATKFQTDQNKNAVYCSMCGDMLYVNSIVFDDVSRAIEKTSDNPFLCEECVEEYEEAAHL